jgi:hypothetical protein
MDSGHTHQDHNDAHKRPLNPEQEQQVQPETAPAQRQNVVALQQVIGNQGVQRLMAQGKVSRPVPDGKAAGGPARHLNTRRVDPAPAAAPASEEEVVPEDEAPVEVQAPQVAFAGTPPDAPPETPEISQRSGRAVQRLKGTAGGGVSTTGAKFTPEMELIKGTKKTQYVDIEYEAGVAGEVAVSWSDSTTSIGVEGKGGSGAKEGAMKVNLPVWQKEVNDQAKAGTESKLNEHLDITSVDVEIEAPKFGSESEGGESKGGSSMGVYLVLKSAAGDEYKPFINLYSSETTGGGSDISGPSAGAEVSILLTPKDFKLTPQEGATIKEITAKVSAKGKLTFKPNYAAIAKKGIEKYGQQWVRQFGARALQMAIARVVYSPAAYAVGAAVSLFAMWAAMKDASDIKEAADKAVAASAGYRNGFMAGIGVPWGSGGDSTWYGHGQKIGVAALDQQVVTILADPEVQPYGFTQEELKTAIVDEVKKKKDDFYGRLYEMVDPKIKAMAVKQWREYKKGLWWYPDAYVDRDEKYLRTRLGLPDQGPLDESGIAAPAE